MQKVVNTICNNCDSEFTLTFNENLVPEYEELICPFCGNPIEDVNEKEIDDTYDMFDQEEWD
jgi:rRNA maturation endonuclease Nob1